MADKTVDKAKSCWEAEWRCHREVSATTAVLENLLQQLLTPVASVMACLE